MRTGQSVWENPNAAPRAASMDSATNNSNDDLSPSNMTLAQRKNFEQSIRNYLITRVRAGQSMGSWKQLRKHVESNTNMRLKKAIWRDYIRSTASNIGNELARNNSARSFSRSEPTSMMQPVRQPKRYVCFVCDDDHSFHRCPILTDQIIGIMHENLGYNHRKEWWYDKANKQRARTFLRALDSSSQPTRPASPTNAEDPYAVTQPTTKDAATQPIAKGAVTQPTTEAAPDPAANSTTAVP